MNKAARITISVVFGLIVLTVAACMAVGLYFVRTGLLPDASFDEKAEISKLSKNYPGLTEYVDSLFSSGVVVDTAIDINGWEKHAYLIRASRPSAKTAVTIHGYTSNPVQMMPYMRMFREMGYNVIMPHLHYHGFSQGKSVQMGWFDRLDVMKWIEVAHENFHDSLMVVHGVSMGAATTMMVSGETLPPYVKGFVEDCGYTSVWDEFSNELRRSYDLGDFPVLYVSDIVCWLKYGWHFKEASSVDQLAKCSLPMLFIHGDADDFVPYSMLQKNYDAKIQGYKEMWSVPGVDHAKSFMKFPEEYTSRVSTFLKEHVE